MRFDEDKVVADILAAVPDAVEIWFHGSRARGDNTRHSDYDFPVIFADGTDPMDTLGRLRPLNPPRRLDDRRRPELDIQSAWESEKERPASVAFWAAEEGRLLYASPDRAPAPGR